MANKRIVTSSPLIVDTGVPVTVNGMPAIVLRREANTIHELKLGRLALRPRQAGFATQDKCLLYRAENGEYNYYYEPIPVMDEWDFESIWVNPPDPNRPDPSLPRVVVVKLKWNLVDPKKPNVPEPFDFPTPEDAETIEDTWNLFSTLPIG